MDEQLDELIQSGTVIVEERLTSSMEADLDPSACLIAGVIRTFSRKSDGKTSADHVVVSERSNSEDRRPRILGGRASLAFETPASLICLRGGRGQIWLTQAVGGLLPFLDATLDFFPGWEWRDRLSWEPSSDDPLVWTRAGRRLAWFERLRGPIRNIYPGDFIYRQPTIARWVCLKSEWDRIADLIGPPRRCVETERAPHDES